MKGMSPTHPGIRFPDRAEALISFEGYRVFLDPWEPIADTLRSHWSGVALRGESGILGIFGTQGTGKTLLAQKLWTDFNTTKNAKGQFVVDKNNFWHRVAGGRSLDPTLIDTATSETEFHKVENQKSWTEDAAGFAKGQQRSRARVLIADNAERAYFRQGLVEMSDIEYMEVANNPALNRLSAERLVDKLRTQLRGTLLVVLSNNEQFLLGLQEEVEAQHAGLMSIANLTLADPRTKETIIRVNTNRLNPASYWSAIDQAAEKDRLALKRALSSDSTFPESFRAVDNASINRIGRPAKKNVITLVTLATIEDASCVTVGDLGKIKRRDLDHKWMSLTTYEEGWAPRSLGEREAGLLESEWVLRLCVLGDPFVRSLLEAESGNVTQQNQVQDLLDKLKIYRGPGTQEQTRANDAVQYTRCIDEWEIPVADSRDFWRSGQHRSTTYERALKSILPGYDTAADGFLTYRPDFVVTDFTPASLLSSLSDDPAAIRTAIRRSAHVFEFTAINDTSTQKIKGYLESKLGNYVSVTQEQ
ncbi:hypothetical protein [Kocuria sp.]|uniref:hypothetical protein n=1 Tax=Kocuria sp. TaxID=1871328 RepID=UPI0026DCF481|nr:hypothetical protein [Kocuria sp.]MDO4918786.1 hypothetical protein [Kocuria sp.]